MSESMESQVQVSKENQFEHAVQVAKRVRIVNIFMSESFTHRFPKVDLDDDGIRLSNDPYQIAIGRNDEKNRFITAISFRLVPIKNDQPIDPAPLLIEATFVLTYTIDSFDEVTNEDLKDFAAVNGVFNAWPYWREFVQNMTMRMSLPSPLVIPLLKL